MRRSYDGDLPTALFVVFAVVWNLSACGGDYDVEHANDELAAMYCDWERQVADCAITQENWTLCEDLPWDGQHSCQARRALELPSEVDARSLMQSCQQELAVWRCERFRYEGLTDSSGACWYVYPIVPKACAALF